MLLSLAIVSYALPLTLTGLLDPLQAPSVGDAISRYDESTSAISSFDIWLKTTRTWNYKSVRIGTKKVKRGSVVVERPVYEERPIPEGEKPPTEIWLMRQVYKRPKRRIEIYDNSDLEIPRRVVVMTGEVDSFLYPRTISGIITTPQYRNLPASKDYLAFIRTIGFVDLVNGVLRLNTERITLSSHGKQIAIYSRPVSLPEVREYQKRGVDVNHLPGLGYNIVLDPAYNSMPISIEEYRFKDKENQKDKHVNHTTHVDEFKKISEELWVPVKVTTKTSISQTVAEIDLSRSKWNTDIPEDNFTLNFPVGFRVNDKIRNIRYVVGKGEPGVDIETLIRPGRF